MLVFTLDELSLFLRRIPWCLDLKPFHHSVDGSPVILLFTSMAWLWVGIYQADETNREITGYLIIKNCCLYESKLRVTVEQLLDTPRLRTQAQVKSDALSRPFYFTQRSFYVSVTGHALRDLSALWLSNATFPFVLDLMILFWSGTARWSSTDQATAIGLQVLLQL